MKLISINNTATYSKYLRSVASLSSLFSDQLTPLINYRTAERLFNLCSGAQDVSRGDSSFDSVFRDVKTGVRVGVGVKTFTATSSSGVSTEKIAEFSNPSYLKLINGLNPKDLALTVAGFRNQRVTADAVELGIDLASSYYHCIVRLPGSLVVHEEPYSLINLDSLYPTDARGKRTKNWSKNIDGHLYFGDGHHLYTFHTGKNVLYKKFDLRRGYTSNPLSIVILKNIFDRIATLMPASLNLSDETGALNVTDNAYLVLPLYSPSKRKVFPKSGINNWNAAGRPRNFGEAYVPIPALVHRLMPKYLPNRDQTFRLALPNDEIVQAKVCQSGGKALMSAPNAALCEWLYEQIDGSIVVAKKRLSQKRPYVYDDLVKIGKDSVVLRRSNRQDADFELEMAELGTYEEWITQTTLA